MFVKGNYKGGKKGKGEKKKKEEEKERKKKREEKEGRIVNMKLLSFRRGWCSSSRLRGRCSGWFRCRCKEVIDGPGLLHLWWWWLGRLANSLVCRTTSLGSVWVLVSHFRRYASRYVDTPVDT